MRVCRLTGDRAADAAGIGPADGDSARSGVLDLSAVELLTVGLDDPAAALDLAERTTGLRFVALVP